MKNQHPKPDRSVLLVALLACWYLTGATPLVDPTRPPDIRTSDSKKLADTGPLHLSAVFLYPNRRIAIISGQLAKVGDQIGAYTITNIQRDTVELKGSEESPVNLMLLPTIKTGRTAN